MKTFSFEIITPETAYPPRDVSFVDVPADQGRLTVLAGHEPLMCCLREGTVRVHPAEGRHETWRIAGGAMTVSREGVRIITQKVEPR